MGQLLQYKAIFIYFFIPGLNILTFKKITVIHFPSIHSRMGIFARSPYYLYDVWHAAKVAFGAGIVVHKKDGDIHISSSVNADI